MILRVCFPRRTSEEAADLWPVDEGWPVDGPDVEWKGETVGCTVEIDAARFGESLRLHLNAERRGGRTISSGFENKVALAKWLHEQLNIGSDVVDVADLSAVARYPNYTNDLFIWENPRLARGAWSRFLVTVRCPECGKVYPAADVTDIEYDLFFAGEFVLVCPHRHHLLALGIQPYILAG
ncbi:MAG: hypothetical protein RIC55_19105 [Pirellulaceae bacterium]